MKKSKSFIEKQNVQRLNLSTMKKASKNGQNNKQSDIFYSNNINHERLHLDNASNLKKVIKELTNLKKQVKKIKYENQSKIVGTNIDVSLCRKINQSKKSSSPSSLSKSKNNSSAPKLIKKNQSKKQIGENNKNKQTNTIKQFSFSIDSQKERDYQKEKLAKFNIQISSSEKNSSLSPQYKKISQSSKKTKRYERQDRLIKKNIIKLDSLNQIENSQIRSKMISKLRRDADIIEIDCRMLKKDSILKMNVELGKLVSSVFYVPEYLLKKQYYKEMKNYIEKLINQLNAFINLINSLSKNSLKQQELQEKPKEQIVCLKCKQNQFEAIERKYRKEIKKYMKQNKRLQILLEEKAQQINSYRLEQNQMDEKLNNLSIENKEIKIKISLLKQQTFQMETKIKQLLFSHQKYQRQIILLQQDKDQLKRQIQIYKNSKALTHRISQDQINQILKINQDFKTIAQLMHKKIQPDINISSKIEQNKPANYYNEENFDQKSKSIDSDDFYMIKAQLIEKKKLVTELQASINKIESQKQHILDAFEMCVRQINNLHEQIDALESANQKYKDKNLKNKLVSQKKIKKQEEAKQRKQKALNQINLLIKKHGAGFNLSGSTK